MTKINQGSGDRARLRQEEARGAVYTCVREAGLGMNEQLFAAIPRAACGSVLVGGTGKLR